MTAIEIVVDDAQVAAAIGRLHALMADTTPILRQIGIGMVRNAQQRMDRGVDPQGRPWVPLNPAYAATKRGPGILREAGMRGGLQGSLTSQAQHGELRVGSNKPYARIQQDGGVIVPKNARALVFRLAGGLVHAKRVTIPARPYLGFGEDDRELVLDVVDVFIRRAMHG